MELGTGMKEKIYTIPVTDAFKEAEGCPFCHIHDKLEKEALDYVMGTSYMEVDTREKTNEQGFCGDHLKMMFEMGNKLGMALMLQTHIAKIVKDLEKCHKTSPGAKKGLFAKKDSTTNFSDEIKRVEGSCFVCNRIDSVLDRYIATFFHLIKKEPEFRALYEKKNLFCLPHLGMLYDKADQEMRDKLVADNMAALKVLEEDIEWFAKKFDYRFNDAPWKNSKDAIQRTVKALKGVDLES